MRADRLVAALLFLQAKGRVTAAELADELEVSLKTARRDLEALVVAGIPVYAQPGRGGGWALLGGARTDLSGLTAAEARALFLVAGPSSTIAPDAKAALRKLVQALPEPLRADARAAASAVVIDPAAWGGRVAPAPPQLAELQRAVIEGRQVRLGYADRRGAVTERIVHPLGLVEKAAVWYLLAHTDAGRRTFRVSRCESVVVTDDPAVRPDDFDLHDAWQSVVADVEEQRSAAHAVVRVPERGLVGMREIFGQGVRVLRELEDGRVELRIAAPSPEWIAQNLAGWGRHVELVESDDVRHHLARIGAELLAQHAAPSVGNRSRRI